MVLSFHSVFGVGLLAGSAIMAACMPLPRTSAPTLSLRATVDNVDELRGQVVRACGTRLYKLAGGRRAWQFVTDGRSDGNAAAMKVLPCGSEEPRLDAASCITGRIARHDGSIRPKSNADPLDAIDVTHPGTTNIWYLHAQCPGIG